MSARRFTPDHVWIDPDGRMGVTEQLTASLRAVAVIHLPSIGDRVRAAEAFAALEGDKGLLDVFAPCDGEVVEVNLALTPEELTEAPLRHWLVRLRGQPGPLLSELEYRGRGPAHPSPRR